MKLLSCLLGILFVVAASRPGAAVAPPAALMPRITVALQPLSYVPARFITSVSIGITSVYAVDVAVLPALALPRNALYAPTGRYRAEALLSLLDRNTAPRYTKVLGLTAVDISATKGKDYDWSISGYGWIGHRPAVVTTYKLGGHRVSLTLFRYRLIKVANHELGHTFGLPHCPVGGCLMGDMKGTLRTLDHMTGAFCAHCRAALGHVLRANLKPTGAPNRVGRAIARS